MINIAIDGPAGAGKSTIAKEIAKRLEFVYVDTGAMYRALALDCIRKGIDSADEVSISKACSEASVTIKYLNGEQCVLLNEENVNSFIRTEEVSKMTSSISVYKTVREKLTNLQRNLAKSENVIMDGRDIGTTVLPNADVKVYLTASPYIRALRRYEQIKDKYPEESLEKIEQEIIERDYRDMNRKIAPLKQASDAVLIDTSEISVEEAIQKIINIIKNKLKVK